ncbi:DNA-packaging protein [Campylobacter lari]|nr:DNA-packaging protein [Campylobacter lari]
MGGRVLTKEELEQKIEEFFNIKKVIKETKNELVYAPKTIESLAVFLGITTKTLSVWEKDADFGELVQMAKQRCASSIIEHSLIGTYTPSVSMFLLKNNHGYVDKQEVVSDSVQK